MKQKVAVIGANSLVGSNIYMALKEKGYDVTGTYFKNPQKDLLQLDITDKSSLSSFISQKNPEIIVNSAGVVGAKACNNEPKRSEAVNLTGAKNLAEICKDNRKKLFHLSTIAVFDGTKKSPYTEKDNPAIIKQGNEYNKTKALAEISAEKVPQTVIIRVGDTYGHAAEQPDRMGGSVFSWIYNELKKNEEISTFTTLRTNQTLLSDIGEATEKLIEMNFEGRINLGGEEITSGEFFEKIIKIFNLPGKITSKPIPPTYQTNRCFDLSLIGKLGIRMQNVNQGLASLVPRYRIK